MTPLRSRRPYKEPFDEPKTVDMIVEESGTHFDPELIKVFKSLRSEFDSVFAKLKDEE
jgi:HD-GYP domain-containing protein (c-di-GMP phosphodiesterase class II)